MRCRALARFQATPGPRTLMIMAEEPELTERELRFVSEYIADPIAVRAYMRAFVCKSYNTARTNSSKLLAQANIKAEIDAAREARAKECGASFKRTLRKLASIAFGDPDDLYVADPENGGLPKPRPWDEIPAHARKNITSVKLKRRKLKGADDCLYEVEELEYKTLDPMAALDKLCKYLGIEKGSLTADELRAIIFGQAAAANGAATAPAQAADGAGGVQGGDGDGSGGLHPDE